MKKILTIVLGLLTFQIFYSIATQYSLADFISYHNAALAVLNHQDPYNIQNIFGYIYPPTSFFLVAPFGLFNYEVSKWIWSVLSMFAFFVTQWILVSTIFKENKITYFLIFSILGLNLFPVKHTIGMGQINLYVILIVSLAYVFSVNGKSMLSGSMVALATAIKISPAILLIYFVKKKQYKTILSFFTTFGLLNALAIILFGWKITKYYWLVSFWGIQKGNADYANQSFTAFLYRLNIGDTTAGLINSLLFVISVIAVFLIITKDKQNPTLSLLEFCLPLELALIFSGITWHHHLAMLVIPMAGLYKYAISSAKAKLFSVISCISIYFLIGSIISKPTVYTGIFIIFISHGLIGILTVALSSVFLLKSNNQDLLN